MVIPAFIPAAAGLIAKGAGLKAAIGGGAASGKAMLAGGKMLYGAMKGYKGASALGQLGRMAAGGIGATALAGGAAGLYKSGKYIYDTVKGGSKKVANVIKPVSKGISKKSGGGRKGKISTMMKPVLAGLNNGSIFKRETTAPQARGPQKLLGGLGSIMKDKVKSHSTPATISRVQHRGGGGRSLAGFAKGVSHMVMPRGAAAAAQ